MNPQLLLICCEGKTEERYFSMLREVFRVSGIDIQIIPCGGQQHRILVDLAIEKKDERFLRAWVYLIRKTISKHGLYVIEMAMLRVLRNFVSMERSAKLVSHSLILNLKITYYSTLGAQIVVGVKALC